MYMNHKFRENILSLFRTYVKNAMANGYPFSFSDRVCRRTIEEYNEKPRNILDIMKAIHYQEKFKYDSKILEGTIID